MKGQFVATGDEFKIKFWVMDNSYLLIISMVDYR